MNFAILNSILERKAGDSEDIVSGGRSKNRPSLSTDRNMIGGKINERAGFVPLSDA